MIYICKCVNKVELPFKVYAQDEIFKLYLSDVGLLTSLLEIEYYDILLNKSFMFKCSIAENYVVQCFKIYYWNSNNKAEIDFLIYNKDGIILVEVKANNNNQSKSLAVYKEKYSPKYSIRISSKNFGFENE